jgi:hypothetical protein
MGFLIFWLVSIFACFFAARFAFKTGAITFATVWHVILFIAMMFVPLFNTWMSVVFTIAAICENKPDANKIASKIFFVKREND